MIDTEYEEVGVILDEVSSFFAYGENEELAEGRALLEADLADGTCNLTPYTLPQPRCICSAPPTFSFREHLQTLLLHNLGGRKQI